MGKVTNDSTTPSAYKRTEVGVIPVDWEVKELGELFSITSSKRVFQKDWKSSGIPFYRARELAILGRKGSVDNELFIDQSLYQKHKLSYGVPQAGDFLVTGVGTLGETYVVDGSHEFYFKDGNIIWFKVQDKLNTHFLEQLYYTPLIRKQIFESSTGSTVGTYTITGALKTLIPFPPKPEQAAIATVLSDVDALIEKTETLIAKKRAIKQGAMEELLTGKRRLPGFGEGKGTKRTEVGVIPEDWEVVPFGNLFEEKISKSAMASNEKISFIGMQDVSETAQLINQNIISYKDLKSGFTYFKKGDVLIAKITPCFENGKGCHTEEIMTNFGFGSTEFHVLRATKFSDSRFIYFWSTFNKLRIDLESEMVGSAGHRRVPFSVLKNYKIPSPKSLPEQTAIATVLSDMDTEIESLEKKLDKYKQLKIGMMQQLLTGKIRLLIPQSV